MPTIDDLHSAFAELETQAPLTCHAAEPRHHPAAESARSGRRRWMLPVLAVATVIAATAIPVAIGLHRSSPPPRPVASPPISATTPPTPRPAPIRRVTMTALAYSFAVRTIAGVTSKQTRAGTDFQQVEVDSTAGYRTPVAWVLAYPSGGFRPTRPANATDVVVDGHPGFAGIIAPTGPGMTATSDGPGLDAIAWQYAAGAWAIVQSAGAQPVGASAPAPRQVADAVDFTVTRPVRVPAKIGYLPSGLLPDSITATVQGSTRSTVVDFTSIRSGQLGMTVEIDTGANLSFGPATHRGSPISLEGFTGYYDAACGSIYLIGKGVYIAITSTEHLNGDCQSPPGMSRPSLTVLTKVLHGLTLATRPTDQSTWFNAAAAIPTH